MKIKLPEYGLISIKMIDDMIEELEGFKVNGPLPDACISSTIWILKGLKQDLIPSEKLADVCYSKGWSDSFWNKNNTNKKQFFNSEIEIEDETAQ